MSHISLTYHIVWRTRRSQRTICEEHERDLYAYIHGIRRRSAIYTASTRCPTTYTCVEVQPTIAVSEFVQVIKQESSRWIKEHREWFPNFDAWGNGYAAFTYSVAERQRVIEYIKNQKVHHHKATFQEEYEALLREFGIDPATDLFLKD